MIQQFSKYLRLLSVGQSSMLHVNRPLNGYKPTLIGYYYSTESNTKEESGPELDDLYKRIVVEVRGHEPAVLDSYERFVLLTAQHLLDCPPAFIKDSKDEKKEKEDASVRVESRELPRFIERWTLLKSRFGNRKHMRQYEMRTYYREFTFKRLTGSTCDTLLEYMQRNLPEGVAMHVHKTKITALPDHYKEEQN